MLSFFSLIWYQIYYFMIKITIATWVWRIALKKVHFEKTPFEAQHFGNGDNTSMELLKVVSQNGQNYIFHSFSFFSK